MQQLCLHVNACTALNVFFAKFFAKGHSAQAGDYVVLKLSWGFDQIMKIHDRQWKLFR